MRLGHAVSSVSRTDQFRVETNKGCFTAPALVLATGGLSIPKMGATGLSYDLARQFGLRVSETRPGLVPFMRRSGQGLGPGLAGVSLEAVASCEKQSFRENILFTHRGLSGPAILQISSYWREGGAITLDLLPDLDAAAFLIERKRDASQGLAPNRARRDHAGTPGASADGRSPAARGVGQHLRPGARPRLPIG